ncbi:MAG TPA: multiheme c-type cytochrome [Acidobacteriaceae bacterium]|nr:multiheme c-type cytochrome [Acidobacteriaceae bacterium]
MSARNALYYFEDFARPVAIPENDWPHIQRTQEATAWFVIGRVQMLQALAMPSGTAQSALLDQAASSVSQALAFNPGDSEITYLRGMIYLAANKVPESTADFATVYKQGGDFAPKAQEQLLTIYTMQTSLTHAVGTRTGFDAFLRNAEEKQPVAPLVVAPASNSKVHLPGYAGSAACKDCHADIYKEWKQTGMAKMLLPYQPQNVIGDFVKNNAFYAGDGITYRYGKLQITPAPDRKLFARMILRNGRHYFEIKQWDGSWHAYPVDYTIGSKWQQAYATTLPNGEIHVFPIQYNRIQKRWVNYWKVLDPAGTERSNPYNWEKLDNATNYMTNCAVCHTSQLHNTGSNIHDADQLAFREPGIDCEMCHGPAAAHIAAISKAGVYTKNPINQPVEFDRISNREFVNICAQCHMQSNLHIASPRGEMNFSSTGTFFHTVKSVPLDEFSRKAFYKDGRFNKTTFIVEALERSQCFRKGQVSCGTCHDPHGHDAESNPTSLKFRDDPDRMCTGCHTQFQNKTNAAAHTHHPLQLEASRCVSCHMPRIVDGLLFRARSHQIDDIPNAEMTERFGQDESPNACLLCHTQKTAQWVQSSLQSWSTKPPTGN